ncbi:SGNH/GDSL hydrolase family protein [Ferruginibacter albus]|uniref:hypothetical protein n=1 Tax=Ferruginibacter albus TaxID=2875540 RepID=UPI001CC6F775|nr:hypothetical protein [Ferruginibacter albus]UAY53382.1 hypothetical protein K9M53_06840 [Ferruginibacter albus]
MYRQRLLITLLSSLLIAWVCGTYFDHRFKENWQRVFFDKGDACANSTPDYDLLFFGDSRVQFGIDPYYVDSCTKLSSFNFGIAGADPRVTALFANWYLENHPAPKIVAINLDEYSIDSTDAFEAMFGLLYYLKSPTVTDAMKKMHYNTALIKLLPFTKYSFFDDYNRMTIFRSDLNASGSAYGKYSYRGFTSLNPLNFKDHAIVIDDGKNKDFKINLAQVANMENIITSFLQKGTKVLLFYPPIKDSIFETEKIKKEIAIKTGTQLSAKFNIPYIRFDTMSLFKTDMFFDHAHLNETGASILSKKMGEEINELIFKQ